MTRWCYLIFVHSLVLSSAFSIDFIHGTSVVYGNNADSVLEVSDTPYNNGASFVQCDAWNVTGGPRQNIHQNIRVNNHGEIYCRLREEFYSKNELGCHGVFIVKHSVIDKRIEIEGEDYVLQPHEYSRIRGGCWSTPKKAEERLSESKDECVATLDERFNGLVICECTTNNCNSKIILRFAKSDDISNPPEKNVSMTDLPSRPLNASAPDAILSPAVIEPLSMDSLPVKMMIVMFAMLIFPIVVLLVSCRLIMACQLLFNSNHYKVIEDNNAVQRLLVENGGGRSDSLNEGRTVGDC